MHSKMDRRDFLRTCAGAAGASVLASYRAFAEPEMGRTKIRDIKVMVMKGPRTYTLIKVETDAGVYGIGEGYGSPGVGVKEQVLSLRDYFIGKDPLNIEDLYAMAQFRTDGSAHMLLRAMSGVETALWDLAGKILNQPVCILLGGKFRDSVRMYHDEGPRDMMDPASCKDWADRMKAAPAGWTAFKYGFLHSDPATDKARDLTNRLLTSQELRDIRKGYENCREALGWERDIIVHCHWEYDLRTAIQLTEAIEPIKPLWLEDPMPPDYNIAWPRLEAASKVPILTGENLARRQGFAPFIVNRGIDIAQLDVRNTGGLLESKKIADFAETYSVPFCSHNTGSIVSICGAMQWAASVRDFLGAETVIGNGGWMDDVIVHDGLVIKDGHWPLPNRPGCGIELNPDVVKAHLAPGEKYWT